MGFYFCPFILGATLIFITFFLIFMKALKVDLKSIFRRKAKPKEAQKEGDQYLSLAISRPSVGSLIIEQPLNRGWAYTTKRIVGRDEDFEALDIDADEIHLMDIITKEDETKNCSTIKRETTPIASRARSCSRFCSRVDD
ncbi:hypothetical protein ACHWQZ_G005985 [Mnemiopsis leidyi]